LKNQRVLVKNQERHTWRRIRPPRYMSLILAKTWRKLQIVMATTIMRMVRRIRREKFELVNEVDLIRRRWTSDADYRCLFELKTYLQYQRLRSQRSRHVHVVRSKDSFFDDRPYSYWTKLCYRLLFNLTFPLSLLYFLS